MKNIGSSVERALQDEAVRMYKRGMPTRRICEQLAMNWRRLMRIVDAAGLARREPGPKPQQICSEEDCSKPVSKNQRNPGRRLAGTRCLFHQRLRWTRLATARAEAALLKAREARAENKQVCSEEGCDKRASENQRRRKAGAYCAVHQRLRWAALMAEAKAIAPAPTAAQEKSRAASRRYRLARKRKIEKQGESHE